MDPERRRVLRFQFVAPAEFVDEASGVRVKTRVTDLSLNGCSLDLVNRLPIGTPVRVKISTKEEFFESQATVAYSHPLRGVGVTFQNLDSESVKVLHSWLVAAMQGNKGIQG
jgi:hypothetical protein